jgi:VWFA-related protein
MWCLCVSVAAFSSVSFVPSVSLTRVSAQPSFSSKIEAVRVDVLVTERDGGGVVAGLGPSDFEVFDNGVPQQVDLVSHEQIPLNVILALDMSESLAGERLDHLRDAGRAVLNGLKSDDQGALVTFSHLVRLGSGLTKDVAALQTALDEAEASGETALVDGTYAAMMLGESDVGRALLIVFSDGVDTASWLTADAVLDAGRRSDAVVYAVSSGAEKNAPFLRDLSEATGGTLFRVESTRNLSATFVRILEEFRHRYLVSYTPRGVPKDGWHRLDVRVKERRALVKARPGYLAQIP